ncbi:MAG: ABC transporter substrate-binding protein [Candidatus Methylomirabilales bacterium]
MTPTPVALNFMIRPKMRWCGPMIALACLLLLSSEGPAQAGAPPRPARVGVVHLSQQAEAPVTVGLRQGLRDLGYAEGRDVVLEVRAGQGRYETALEAARELVRAQVHLFVSAGTVATKAVKEAAGDLPIVFTQIGDPVAAGFARSLSRPGGNMTGFSHLLVDTTGKRLELLRELVPGARSVLVIFDPKNPTSATAAAEARPSAEKLRVGLQERHVKNRDEVLAALREVDRNTVDAILMLPDSLVANAGEQIIETSRQKRVPVMFHEETWVDRGGLASYGASFVDLGRQAARYVDKILKGAKPGDLPVEQPTRFELVINLKTANALGLTIPQSLLIRADRVIQ